MKWIYLTGTIVVIGGVMSYGLICYYAFDFNRDNSVTMVGMIPLMVLVYIAVIKIIISGMEKKMGKLFDGIHEVSSGNFEYKIDLKDADEYKQLYEEFNNMSLELYKTRAEIEAFTNEFAHEFKTPITAINGFAELLYETGAEIENEERLSYLQLIKEESERLCTLSQDTLLLSKVNSIQILSEKQEYDIYEQIRRCIILLENDLNKKNIDVEIDEDTIIKFDANPELMEHVWINLLTNAIKHSPKNSTITVKSGDAAIRESDLSLEKYNCCISISDMGKGMDKDTLDHIFDKYYQKDKFSPGNGIGLAIVKRIVDLNGGNIFVKSSEGNGSTFTIVF